MKSKYLDSEEVKTLQRSMSFSEWLPLWVALETGLRVGDICKIKRRDIKADGIHYVAQKTGKRGVARISSALRKELTRENNSVWVFPSPKTPSHITRQALWQRLKRAALRANVSVEGVSPHSLRKVFSVELYREKGFEAVKEALQHSNAATTEIYTFADWNTGKNAEKPLKRKDLELIVKLVLEALGDYKKELEKSQKNTL